MPELREVFEMTTKQVEPDVDAWREQERHHRRSSRNKRLGGFAVAAAIGVATVVLVFFLSRTEPSANRSAADSSPTPRTAMSALSFLDLQTGETTPLPESLHGGSLYFVSPDRTMFVINSCCSPPNPVSVANVDGTGVRQVTPDGVDGFAARWSPNGSSLVYQGRDAATAEIGNLFVVDVTTRETTQITDLDPVFHGAWSMHPSFSADGQTIIFHMPRGPDDASTRFDLWRVPVAGGEPTLVVRNASTGVYAPDGETLAYLDSPRGDASSSSRLMLADVDGSDPRLLVEGDQVESPRWSPDATRIAYSDTDGTHVVDVSTGEASLVTADAAVLDWFGNDTLVVIP